MDLLQGELDEICDLWNNHQIVRTRQGHIHGVPNQLYHLPEVQGIILNVYNYILLKMTINTD